ncbi:nitrate- and nitrite sensing domain-containing protein [Streptomyces europaeiscabiei]|uniref:sensor histidine kinase n=1 Tax=Streptomyces TaxID=1883 RepID=UPI000A3D1734|nr:MULTISPECIES: nitrate- and nitrite sensing domain-containing protein [Streptomyces]MDX3636062.1 nitrate- and nitrite sensing domain-containing protein [Streptomyces europaeiscabiei]MDX3654138.1 nitrate- and nitrite sensing domain-containing protein [Streptomyces europaeiscabiei]WUD31086.1 nitrate- and nitrite sensing domain-containing protein [Streptomyces europaeiscabiei]
MPPRTGARRRLGSIRLSLILLALIPSVTLAVSWGVTTTQMFSEGLRLRTQTGLSKSTGAMGTEATLALQRERALSAAYMAAPGSSMDILEQQRQETDKAVAKLAAHAGAIEEAPDRIGERLYSVMAGSGSLEYYRGQVDSPTDITPEQILDQYTEIIDGQIHAFQALSQVDDGDLTSQAGPLITLEQAAELVSQGDAILTLNWPSGELDEPSRNRFAQVVNARRWLVDDQLIHTVEGEVKTKIERIVQGEDWQTLQAVEDQVLSAHSTGTGESRRIKLPQAQARWDAAMTKLSTQYEQLIREQTTGLLDRSSEEARSLLITAGSLSAGGLAALLLCVVMSWRITRSLSRRLTGLRTATLSLAEERLPDIVARLDRGEKVDVDAAAAPLDYGTDELGQVAKAFNAAQRTAVHTAVELADTRRGFQRVILGIARQSQNLVNLQLTKLDSLERQHQDPEILKGLYELDSTASQLRRYEENLVIISGERPGRSWTEPVALIDILRSAVGEVAQYQRVEVHADDEVWIAPPAVADVIHLLAELIDNATTYSPAPSPVSVRAAIVAKGLALEVEDRGLGMSEEDYTAFNAQLAVPPQFDVVALADDLRLGMFVIARLATRHGITVTLRASPYGGTTAIVLIPDEIVVREAPAPDEDAGDAAEPPVRTSLVAARVAAADPHPEPEPVREEPDRVPQERPAANGRAAEPVKDANGTRPAAARKSQAGKKGGLMPLPRRVPQTSLAAELKEEAGPCPDGDADDFTAERAASSLAGFQRGTLQARDDDEEPEYASGEASASQDPGDRIPASGT